MKRMKLVRLDVVYPKTDLTEATLHQFTVGKEGVVRIEKVGNTWVIDQGNTLQSFENFQTVAIYK